MQSSLYGQFRYDNHKTRTRKIILSTAKMILKKQISLSSLPSCIERSFKLAEGNHLLLQ